MAKKNVRAKRSSRRSLFAELMAGVQAMREHREGHQALRTRKVEPIVLRP